MTKEYVEPRVRLSQIVSHYNEYKVLDEVSKRLSSRIGTSMLGDGDALFRVDCQKVEALDKLVIAYLLQQNASFISANMGSDLSLEEKKAVEEEANRRYINPIEFIDKKEWMAIAGKE